MDHRADHRPLYSEGLAEVRVVGNHTFTVRARTGADGDFRKTGRVYFDFPEPFVILACFPYVKTVRFGQFIEGIRPPVVSDFKVAFDFERNQYLTNDRTEQGSSGSGQTGKVNLASFDGERRLFLLRLEAAKPQIGFEFEWDYDTAPLDAAGAPVQIDVRMDMIAVSCREWDARAKGTAALAALGLEIVGQSRRAA